MRDFGLVVLRAITGGLLVGHGMQKLFGAFEGHGVRGTGQLMEKLGLRPGEPWAITAGLGRSPFSPTTIAQTKLLPAILLPRSVRAHRRAERHPRPARSA